MSFWPIHPLTALCDLRRSQIEGNRAGNKIPGGPFGHEHYRSISGEVRGGEKFITKSVRLELYRCFVIYVLIFRANPYFRLLWSEGMGLEYHQTCHYSRMLYYTNYWSGRGRIFFVMHGTICETILMWQSQVYQRLWPYYSISRLAGELLFRR